ncbi:TetR family transcriptional regulator [Kribbella sp. HUAS MG21]|jgi:DNA-binding transcriptional regulator YbjK|uniref:TetR family transcriptional regulator n=1 Tax=Kribbella sp. HUAS MG21 TaxID=3160966 RepID=A0AAU7T524_9ACTN
MATDGRLARGQARRQEILRGAIKLIAEQGVSAVTHRAVAEAAGVPAASTTYHFETLDALLVAAFHEASSQMRRELAELTDRAVREGADVVEVCGDYAVTMITDRRDGTLACIELALAAVRRPALVPVSAELFERLTDLIALYVDERRDAATLGAAIQGLLLMAFLERDDGVRLRAAVVDLLHHYGVHNR